MYTRSPGGCYKAPRDYPGLLLRVPPKGPRTTYSMMWEFPKSGAPIMDPVGLSWQRYPIYRNSPIALFSLDPKPASYQPQSSSKRGVRMSMKSKICFTSTLKLFSRSPNPPFKGPQFHRNRHISCMVISTLKSALYQRPKLSPLFQGPHFLTVPFARSRWPTSWIPTRALTGSSSCFSDPRGPCWRL